MMDKPTTTPKDGAPAPGKTHTTFIARVVRAVLGCPLILVLMGMGVAGGTILMLKHLMMDAPSLLWGMVFAGALGCWTLASVAFGWRMGAATRTGDDPFRFDEKTVFRMITGREYEEQPPVFDMDAPDVERMPFGSPGGGME